MSADEQSQAAEPVSVTRLSPEAGQRFQRLRSELGVSSFGMNLMTLQPGQVGRIHRHDRQEEVYVVLEGELTLAIEGEEQTLSRYDVAHVAAPLRRQLLNRGGERTVVLALGGAGPHEGRDGKAFTSWEERGEGRPPQEVPLPQDLF